MSTAWYRSNVIPQRIGRWKVHPYLAVEVWDTTCIVTNFKADLLINPANPNLSGISKFPYFPKGGPEPNQPPAKDAHHIMGYVTQWGGMEVGQGMMFAANVVDGLVHQVGGKSLLLELQSVGRTCDHGNAVWTSSHGDLKQSYPYGIIHTVPPFYDPLADNTSSSLGLLQKCYWSSLNLAQQKMGQRVKKAQEDDLRVACPLLGAGCRGFPVDLAMQSAVAALAAAHPLSESPHGLSLAFAIPSGEIREALSCLLDEKFDEGGEVSGTSS